HVVGSYALKCSTRTNNDVFEVDLALEFAKSCWQKKDHTNYVYHRKRGLYLAYVAKQVSAITDIISSVQFGYAGGDRLKPILVITPSGKLGSLCRFHVSAFASIANSFVFGKFAPDRCHLDSSALTPNCKLDSTPLYNSSIL